MRHWWALATSQKIAICGNMAKLNMRIHSGNMAKLNMQIHLAKVNWVGLVYATPYRCDHIIRETALLILYQAITTAATKQQPW